MVNDLTTTRKRKGRKGNYIRSLLALHGITMKEIAEQEGVSLPMISMTAAGDRKSPRVRRAIAKALGMTYLDLWREEDKG